jgi:hypothetical protein
MNSVVLPSLYTVLGGMLAWAGIIVVEWIVDRKRRKK